MATKYHSKAVVLADGTRFDSTHEYQVWLKLITMQQAGEISDLQRQVRYPLAAAAPGSEPWSKVGTYVADFVYTCKDGARHVIDAKGYRTPLYKLKKKIFEANYGLPIEEF